MGGLIGAAITYGIYFHAIDIFEGPGIRTLETAGIFATFSVRLQISSTHKIWLITPLS